MSIIEVAMLRALAKEALSRYMDATAGIDPGSNIMQPLNDAAQRARIEHNKYMDELAKLVPGVPKERL